MDSINMNVFRKIKENKALKQNSDISKPKSVIAKKTGTVNNINAVNSVNTVNTVKTVKPQIKSTSLIKTDKLENQFDIKASISNKGVLTAKNENTKETLIAAYVKDKDNPNNVEIHAYKVKTRTPAAPNFDDIPINSVSKQGQQQLDPMTKDMFVGILKNNKLTEGTKIMMENDLQHAKEAIESGIYVTWTSKSVKFYLNNS